MNMKMSLVMLSLLSIWPFGVRTYHMTADPSVPAASGTLRVRRDKANGNMSVDVSVEHLANPANLTPSKTVYIVWVRPNGEDSIKEGAIGVGKKLKGEIKALTTSKSFDVFITAESSETVTEPRGIQVLQAHVSP